MTDRFSTPVDGVELSAEQIEGVWHVSFGSKVGQDEHIDLAVAKAMEAPPTVAMEVVKRLFPPGT